MSGAATPRAVIADALGEPSSFALRPHDPGLPGPGQVRIAVHAAGVSFVDVLIASGGYQLKPRVPFIPGSEFSGVIEAVGEDVPASRIGERVCASTFGTVFAEAAVIAASAALAIPDSMSFEEASIFRVSYATAYYALVQRGALKAGETLLVLGAAGAVGYAAVEIGKALGARVIGSASSAEKRALVTAGGADAVVDSRSASWRDDVKAANGGKPVDVVIDPVGGSATEPAFRSLAWKGRHLVIGFAEGTIPKLPVNLALLKGAALVGVDIRQFGMFEPEASEANVAALFTLHGEGKLHPPVASRYPLDDFVAAMEAARAGKTAGRIILTMRS